MKKTLLFVLSILLYACSDGDLTIEPIDFEGLEVQFCDEGTIDTSLFFKIEDDETLILQLESGLLQNTVSETPILSTISESSGSSSNLTYRFFTGTITSDYFCDDIPPADPTVIEEVLATSGTLSIETALREVTSTASTFDHTITITEVTLVNNAGERVTDSSDLEFGVFTTTGPNNLSQSFRNFDNVNLVPCEIQASVLRVFKAIAGEVLYLDVPLNLIVNQATENTPRIAPLNQSNALVNSIVSGGVPSIDAICSGLISNNIINQFSATDGTISVTTLENTPGADGIVTFTHTLQLSNLIFQDQAGTIVQEIDMLELGSFTTF